VDSSNEKIIFEDNFAAALGEGWSWLRENPDGWRIRDGGLEICVEPGVAETVRNALVREAPDRSEGTLAIEVTVTNHTLPTQQYEQAGITWYNAGQPVFKEVKELIDGQLYIIPGKQPMPTRSVRLRLLVTADSWEAQYCPQGETEFRTAASGELPPPANDQVSIQCYNGPSDEQHWIRFDTFRIKRLA
jgi:hypothetical protein